MLLQWSAKTLPYLRYGNAIRQGRGHDGRPIQAIVYQRFYATASSEKKEITSSTAESSKPGDYGQMRDHRVNKTEKFFLVWGGKYKKMAEVPDFVSQNTLERARNKARIKINLMMGALTLVCCVLMIMSGKKAQKEGASVTKMNEEWHKQIKESEKLKQASKLADVAAVAETEK